MVSVFDHSFLYGDGAFESIPCRNGRPFEGEAHVARLIDSCQFLMIDLPLTGPEMVELVSETIRQNEAKAGDVRIVVTRGEGYPMSDPRQAQDALVIFTMQQKPVVNYPQQQGLRLCVPSTRRVPPECIDPRVKSNNYLNHILAKVEAIRGGYDDALMLTVDGHVAELPGANIFTFKDGLLSTPELGNILAGITRATILELARGGSERRVREVCEAALTLHDFYTADEVFATGSGTGVAFVSEIDGRTIGGGTCGPVTQQLGNAYNELLNAL
jgi:branched-chain amino acid aminotransferase